MTPTRKPAPGAGSEPELKHTPGPWRADGTKIIRDGNGATEDTTTFLVVDLLPGTGESKNITEANARLIAAAPDLLALLRDVSHQCELDPDILPPDAGLLKDIRAAIAKATKP